MSHVDDLRMIEVEVALKDGQRHASVLPSDSEILRDLYLAMSDPALPGSSIPGALLQLPLNNGHAACTFSAGSIVSVITRPPVLVEADEARTEEPIQAYQEPTPKFVRIDDFLTPAENAKLLEYTLENKDNFQQSNVTTKREGYRKSRVLYEVRNSEWPNILINRLNIHLPHIARNIIGFDFNITKTEIQLTSSNDGDYFKIHADHSEGVKGVSLRELTYVYYFYREPRAFSGGNLLLYSGKGNKPADRISSDVTSIEPSNNCLIAFASDQMHEVELVRCPSEDFADSRFTINGWLSSKSG